MNYHAFINDMKARVRAQIDPDIQLQVQKIPRNNGTSYDGLILFNPGRNISPTIYLTPYYHRYLEGVSLEDICSDILSAYDRQLPLRDFDTSRFTDFSKVSPRIVMRLVNRARNERMLSLIPSFPFHDLAVIFYCLLSADSDNQASILVHNEHLALWDVGAETLFQLSRENSPALLPPQITPMRTLLFPSGGPSVSGLDDCDIPMYVVSNLYRTNGASAILYEQVLQQLSGQLGTDLILLPSSVHEFIAIPAAGGEDLSAFDTMVCEVNETQLADDEVLADHAYYYDRKMRLISM